MKIGRDKPDCSKQKPPYNGEMTTFEKTFPHISEWVGGGWIEIGCADPHHSSAFVQVLDEGGCVWEGEDNYPSIDDALIAMDAGIKKWAEKNEPEMVASEHDSKPYSPKHGQYLAFIYNYTQIHGRPPAQADLQQFFQTSPPSIHQMIKTLEKKGLISRIPRTARSITILVPPEHLPMLERPS